MSNHGMTKPTFVGLAGANSNAATTSHYSVSDSCGRCKSRRCSFPNAGEQLITYVLQETGFAKLSHQRRIPWVLEILQMGG